MDSRSWLQPLTGVLFVLLVIASFVLLGDEPPDATDEPIQDVIDFYVDNEDETFMSGVLGGLAGAVLIFFGGYLAKRLRASGAQATAAVSFAGSIVLAVAFAIDGTITVALAELANGDEIADPGAVQALSALWHNDFVPIALGLSVFLWGTGAAIVRHEALPKWVGWVLMVAAITAISPAFPVAAVVALLFVLASSIVFARKERAGGTA